MYTPYVVPNARQPIVECSCSNVFVYHDNSYSITEHGLQNDEELKTYSMVCLHTMHSLRKLPAICKDPRNGLMIIVDLLWAV